MKLTFEMEVDCSPDQTIERGDEVQGGAPRDDPVAGALVAVAQVGGDDHNHLFPRTRPHQAPVPAPDDLARPQGKADWLPVLVGVERLSVRQEALVGDLTPSPCRHSCSAFVFLGI